MLSQTRETLAPLAGSKLIVAVSGGLDSVALLDILLHLREELGLTLVVAHADHGVRRSSRKDAEFVASLAAHYSLPFAQTKLALAPGGNLEARAREARYRWLEQIRRRRRADYIVTAHQADDQVETLFLRITRGSGLTGLSGMRSDTGRIKRPLLDVPRKDLSRYVRRRRLRYRLDPTNRSVKIARNRVRRQVVTSLSRINPQLIETVSQSMRVLDEEYGVLTALAAQQLAVVTERRTAKSWQAARPKLVALSRGVRHLVWREALRNLLGDLNGLRLSHLENLDDLLLQQTGRQIHLPRGLVASRSYEHIVVKLGNHHQTPTRQTLTIPGEVVFGHYRLRAKRRGRPAAGSIAVDATAVSEQLIIRPPKIGDRLRPAGMRGSKLVSDMLTDAKVPRDERPWVPVVTTRRGELVWLAGHRADRRFAAKPGQPAVWLSLSEA